MPQDEYSRGELYRATHETSGVTALVFRPTEDGSAPLSDWRVRCISSGSPSYLALEVEHSPRSMDPERQSMEELVCVFEDVHEGVKRMSHAFPVYDEPRSRWRLGLALAGAARRSRPGGESLASAREPRGADGHHGALHG